MKKKLIILMIMIPGISLFSGCESVREESIVSYKKEDEVSKIKLDQSYEFETAELKVLNTKEVSNVKTKSGQTNANGKFIVIEISLKNTSREDIEYSPISLQLINNEKEYHIDENSFETLQKLSSQKITNDKDKNYIMPYTIINPGITKKSFAVFDVPKDLKVNDTKLIVEGNEHIQFDINK
ncbi:DUF4352 domain-containing protein [Eubacterium multiforme]|uniref:DUF4352 domain-containing protein n=1 Tax=Eubacterium multiforme TaxID=83339 RepID=A0ABT9US25_9FIRM|nr:DUF4352 domain-containing protein [Eubacterium multiforme]MDQ0149110.1 hypothetical protein [Eubacterium multiforme]